MMFKLILYRVFQLFVTLPVMVVATVVAGLITVLGSWLGSSGGAIGLHTIGRVYASPCRW